VVIPLYCVAMLTAYFAARVQHHLRLRSVHWCLRPLISTRFLNPTDLIWSFFQAIVMAIVIMMVHTYYGFHRPPGGRQGVGEGRRSISTYLTDRRGVCRLVLSLAIYGQSGKLPLRGLAPWKPQGRNPRNTSSGGGHWPFSLSSLRSSGCASAFVRWIVQRLCASQFDVWIASGLVMEPRVSKVKLRGVEVGRGRHRHGAAQGMTSLKLDMFPESDAPTSPANVHAEIKGHHGVSAPSTSTSPPRMTPPERG